MLRVASVVLCGALAGMGFCSSSSAETLAEGWNDLDRFLFNEAQNYFRTATANSPASERERKLGEAVTLLTSPNHTADNVDHAVRLLEEIISVHSPDDTDTFARFLLARIWEMHQTPADLAKARALYLDLLKLRSGTPLAEYGASKIALIDLYENMSPRELNKRLDELDKLEPLLKTSSGRREFHTNVGIACSEVSGPPERALRHLLAADQEGITLSTVESTVWILIACDAETSGNLDLAKIYYQKFLDKYKHDNRYFTIQEKLKKLLSGQKDRA